MILVKVIGVAFVTLVCYNLLKNTKADIALLLVTASGILMIVLLSDYFVSAFSFLENLSEKAGIPEGIFALLLKVLGIGYLVEYSASICNDCGCSSLAKKIEMGGKLVILVSAIPVFSTVTEMLEELF